MTSSTLRERRLPGLHFEVTPNVGRTALPRMDVAGFVGLAEAGPFDTPVLVEDALRFRDVFGDDVALTVEQDGSPATSSLLGAAVEAFFANGGRLCWVVRVGSVDEAASTRFRVPGLVTAPLGGGIPAAAEVVARSPGAGFDQHEAIGWVTRRRLPPALEIVLDAAQGQVLMPQGMQAGVGELVELTFPEGLTVWAPIASIEATDFGRRSISWATSEEVWFSKPAEQVRASLSASLDGAPLTNPSSTVSADGSVSILVPGGLSGVELGAVVALEPDGDAARRQVFMVDQPAEQTSAGGSVLRGRMSRELWDSTTARAAITVPERISVVKLNLGSRLSGGLSHRVADLDVATSSTRSWRLLHDDSELFGGGYRRHATAGEHPEPGRLDDEITSPRFPFACDTETAVLPLLLSEDPIASTAGRAQVPNATTYQRNGIDSYSDAWFIDPEFATKSVSGIRLDAPRTFFVDEQPLRGVLALYPIADVAVVSAPDCLHLGWSDEAKAVPSPLPAPQLRVDDSQDLLQWDPYPVVIDVFEVTCASSPDFSTAVEVAQTELPEHTVERDGCELAWCRVRAIVGDRTSPWSNTVVMQPGQQPFATCETAETPFPVLVLDGTGLTDRVLRWTLEPTPAESPTRFEVETSPDPLFVDADRQRMRPTVTNAPQELAVSVPEDGVRFWRVRESLVGDGVGPWSNTVHIEASPVQVRVAAPFDGDVPPITLDIHRHLAAVAAARQDFTVLISFPRAYRLDHVEDHVGELHADSYIPAGGDRTWAEFLHPHHPWLGVPAAQGRRWVPADGAIAGGLAATAIQRGPWIAAVGAPLEGVTAIERVSEADVLRLRQVQVNSFLPRRQRMYAMGVDTLSTDAASIPVTIRRLMILLRRLARREGELMVFENNGPVLWRIVSRRFEAVLADLLRRGALAGRSPVEAYRVICDGSTNPPASVDNGRLVVELQVAPAHPLEFLTVRMTQTDAGGFEFVGGRS